MGHSNEKLSFSIMFRVVYVFYSLKEIHVNAVRKSRRHKSTAQERKTINGVGDCSIVNDGTTHMDVHYAGSTWLIETIKTGLRIAKGYLRVYRRYKGTNDPFEFSRDEKDQSRSTFY